MLKPYVVVAAALSAFVVPAIGAQLAVAAEPSTGLHAPAVMPNATPTPVPDSTEGGMDDETMPGMDHGQPADMDDETMPGMDHGQPADMDDETMPGMDHGQPADMDDETMPGMDHGETPASHDSHGVETVSEPRPVAALVGAFAAVNGGVMISAAVLRRHDKRRANSSPKPAHPAK